MFNNIIINYKNHIEDIAKHVCYCCKRLCFAYQISYALNHILISFLMSQKLEN
jgi:hypothetical protein